MKKVNHKTNPKAKTTQKKQTDDYAKAAEHFTLKELNNLSKACEDTLPMVSRFIDVYKKPAAEVVRLGVDIYEKINEISWQPVWPFVAKHSHENRGQTQTKH